MRAALLIILLILINPLLTRSAGQERLTFVGVALDMETRQADRKLQTYLNRKSDVSFAPEEMEYGRVIDRLVSWRETDGPYLARVTPYVYVVAEMLGANFEILATYVSSSTGNRTYHSYLVVNRKDFPSPPTLPDVMASLEHRKERGRFIYQSRFSTSSFFVPSLYFRSHKVYHMPESTESLIAIASDPIEENSSSKLVELVAQGKADLAAVWDGTKAKFEPGGPAYEQYGKNVYFVQFPTSLPNDLLICSSSLDSQVKEHLRSALSEMGPDEIATGDFKTWNGIREAADARQALADLRWLAREHVPATTVEIRLKAGTKDDRAANGLVDAAKQAVRLSGTEMVLYDEDFHEHIDITWTLEPVHDGAVVLRSAIPGSGIEEQVFRLSFRDAEDLTHRIVTTIQSRMHRIRYVWGYSTSPPTIIRDQAFSLGTGTAVKVQRISWLDPEKNKFRAGPVFNARIRNSGFYRYELDPDDFSKSGESVSSFDPLSNASYRVYLIRPSEERTLFQVLTVALIALLALAAAGAAYVFQYIG